MGRNKAGEKKGKAAAAEYGSQVGEVKKNKPSNGGVIVSLVFRCVGMGLLLVSLVGAAVILGTRKAAYWAGLSLYFSFPAFVLAGWSIYLAFRGRLKTRRIVCLVGCLMSGAGGLGSIWIGVLLTLLDDISKLNPHWPPAWLCFFAGSSNIVSAIIFVVDVNNFCMRTEEKEDPPSFRLFQGLRWAVLGLITVLLLAGVVLLAMEGTDDTRVVFGVTQGIGLLCAGLAVLNLALDDKRWKLKIAISIGGGVILIAFQFADMVLYCLNVKGKGASNPPLQNLKLGFYLFIFFIVPAFFASAGFFLTACCSLKLHMYKKATQMAGKSYPGLAKGQQSGHNVMVSPFPGNGNRREQEKAHGRPHSSKPPVRKPSPESSGPTPPDLPYPASPHPEI